MPPKSFSVSILLVSFWFFSAICVSTYQANLAASFTSQTLQTKINSIKDLLKETNIEYSAVGKLFYKIILIVTTSCVLKLLNKEGSAELNSFMKLKNLEMEFYNLWKNVGLKLETETDELETNAYAVWDYPLPGSS